MARSGLVVVDKPPGLTSHDVVARVRRIVGSRKVGHAGTLDPMATGVLVLGVERGTKLLGYLGGADKTYRAGVRLGVATSTDDAEGEPLRVADASAVSEAQVRTGLAALTGAIEQVPSTVSAIKVGGRRAYALARAGETVELKARPVTVHSIELLAVSRAAYDGVGVLDLDVRVRCSAGTYVRAIARDLGAGLGVGGSLTALRRTASGAFTQDQALSLERLADVAEPVVIGLDEAAATTFPVRRLRADEAAALSFGRRLEASGTPGTTYAALDPDGRAVALLDASGRPAVVFRPA